MSLPWGNFLNQRDVRETPVSKFSTGEASPIGAILAWLKDFTNTPALPDGWIECNGQTLSDPNSVYNGQVIPDLNGDNRFLRGNSTTGGVGGNSSVVANLDQSGGVLGDTAGVGSSSDRITATAARQDMMRHQDWSAGGTTTNILKPKTDSFSILPPYYNVVWIMRIK